jgi:hypothetical protein
MIYGLWPYGFVSCLILASPGASASLIAPRRTQLNLISIADRLGVLKWLNLTRAANQSRSHPPMSVTWNLVSERARRIPGAFSRYTSDVRSQ